MAQRLVYSPKVYAYLKTDATRAIGPDAFLDVSDFIVSGEVQRVINAVSSASLVLRNPDRIWTQPSQKSLLPCFTPWTKSQSSPVDSRTVLSNCLPDIWIVRPIYRCTLVQLI